jgi:hypothetical protein
MDFSPIAEFFGKFETGRVFEYLKDLNLEELIHNPWFLGSTALLSIIALIMRWRVLLALILGLTGFAWLISYTLQQETTIGSLSSGTLLIFVGGGSAIIFLIIYLLFIRSD